MNKSDNFQTRVAKVSMDLKNYPSPQKRKERGIRGIYLENELQE